MHNVALHLAPVLAAEKSKVPFYVAGSVLVVWALILSMGIGGARPEFPSNASQQRGVIAITAALVLATLAMAVITSGTPAKSVAASNAAAAAPAGETPPMPEVTSTATTGSTASAPEPAPAPAPAPSKPAKKPAAPRKKQPAGGKKQPAVKKPPPAVSSLSLAADPGGALSYNTKSLSAKAGTVTITMANASPVEHNVTIAQGTKVLGATPTFAGGSKTLTVTLKPGKYTFYCSVPGHRPAGMEGTLTVS